MKKILMICFLLISLQSKSQTFDGIYIGGGATACIEKFKAKGYRVVEYSPEFRSYKLMGKKDGMAMECYLFKNKSGKVRSIDCYLPKKYTFESLLSQFNTYKESLTAKYGEPLRDIYEFEQPYFLGDGFELQALLYHKLKLVTLFNGGENSTVTLVAYSTAQVCIGVSNDANEKEHEQEKNQSIQNTF
jgi:hypothetical protein